jgi:hypothetical protein
MKILLPQLQRSNYAAAAEVDVMALKMLVSNTFNQKKSSLAFVHNTQYSLRKMATEQHAAAVFLFSLRIGVIDFR